MKTVSHTNKSRDKLLHVEAEGVTVNIQVGLVDYEGRQVTRIDVLPDGESRGGDASGYVWDFVDGARVVRRPKIGAAPHPLMRRLAAGLTFEELEVALSALASLYDNSGDDTGDYLSERQQEIAERVRAAKLANEDAEATR